MARTPGELDPLAKGNVAKGRLPPLTSTPGPTLVAMTDAKGYTQSLAAMPHPLIQAAAEQGEKGISSVIMEPNAASNRMAGRLVTMTQQDPRGETVRVLQYCYQAKPLDLKFQSSRNPFFRGGIPADYLEGRQVKADIKELRSPDAYHKKIKKMTKEGRDYSLKDVEYSQNEILHAIAAGALTVERFDGEFLEMSYPEDMNKPKRIYRVNLNAPLLGNFLVPEGKSNLENVEKKHNITPALIAALQPPGTNFFTVEVKKEAGWEPLKEMATKDGLPIRSDNDTVIVAFHKEKMQFTPEDTDPAWMKAPHILVRRFNTENIEERQLLMQLIKKIDPEMYQQLDRENLNNGNPHIPPTSIQIDRLGNISALEAIDVFRFNITNRRTYHYMRDPIQHGSNAGCIERKIPFKKCVVTNENGEQRLIKNETELLTLIKEGWGFSPATMHYDINPHWVERSKTEKPKDIKHDWLPLVVKQVMENKINSVENIEGWFSVVVEKMKAGMPVFLETAQLLVDDPYFQKNLSNEQRHMVAKYVTDHCIVPIPIPGPYMQNNSNHEAMKFKIPEGPLWTQARIKANELSPQQKVPVYNLQLSPVQERKPLSTQPFQPGTVTMPKSAIDEANSLIDQGPNKKKLPTIPAGQSEKGKTNTENLKKQMQAGTSKPHPPPELRRSRQEPPPHRTPPSHRH